MPGLTILGRIFGQVGPMGPSSPRAWDHRTGPLCHAADIVWTSQGMIPISRRRPEGCPFRGGELTGGLNRQPRHREMRDKTEFARTMTTPL
jgi:hypothetical protein